MPTACILAVIRAESDFDADARSKAGAIGLMQLMPGTYAFIADELLAEPLLPDQISDPATNIRCGTAYLAYLLEKFKDLRVALAAYNAGEHRVATWLADASLTKNGILLHIPFPETEAYVAKVTRYYKNYCKKYPMEEKKHENCKRTDRRALLR